MQVQAYQGYIKQGLFTPFNGVMVPDSDEVILTIVKSSAKPREIDKQAMLERVHKLCGIVPPILDEKAELAQASEEEISLDKNINK